MGWPARLVTRTAHNWAARHSLRRVYGHDVYIHSTPTMGSSDQAQLQAKIFKWMPWMFMFILAGFPAGLLIYWIWNNILSFAQQYWITRQNGVDTPVDKFFRKLFGKPEPVAEGAAVEVKPNSVKKKKKPKSKK